MILKSLSTALLSLSATALLASCSLVKTEPQVVPKDSEETSSEEPIRETKNVTYVGVVQPAGISIYMEGTHRLVLSAGKFILLESATLDLNGYVGENVEVFGSLRPTVEAGGMIMRVERIRLLSSSSSSESSLLSSSEESEDSSLVVSSDALSSVRSSPRSSTPALSSASAPSASAEFFARVEAMAKEDFSAPNWTQSYCTSHVQFCAPVHRNWWFKSFGTTTTSLWHVEISSEPLENLGGGPISIDLLTGSESGLDGTIETRGTQSVGFKSWTENRHFQVTADPRLKDAIRYIIDHLTEETAD